MRTAPNTTLIRILRAGGWMALTALFFSVYVYSWSFVV